MKAATKYLQEDSLGKKVAAAADRFVTAAAHGNSVARTVVRQGSFDLPFLGDPG